MISIKIKTISMVQLPPPKSQKNLFHVTLTKRDKLVLNRFVSLFIH